jgi:hypothetical protein
MVFVRVVQAPRSSPRSMTSAGPLSSLPAPGSKATSHMPKLPIRFHNSAYKKKMLDRYRETDSIPAILERKIRN